VKSVNFIPKAPQGLYQSLADKVAGQLSAAIANGELRPGERLIEEKLAEGFGVSRGPVREALKMLCSVGLVEIRPNRGTYVAHAKTQQFDELIVMRAMVEGLAARLATSRATPEARRELEDIVGRMEEMARKGRAFALRDVDWSFHERICVLSGSELLLEVWRAMRDKIRTQLHLNPKFAHNPKGVLANHRAYIKAVFDETPDDAERIVRAMILENGFTMLGKPLPPAFSRARKK